MGVLGDAIRKIVDSKDVEIEALHARVAELEAALRRLCDAADDLGVHHLDPDDLGMPAQEMREATLDARELLTGVAGNKDEVQKC